MKRATRIALGIPTVYLTLTFLYTAIDMRPWSEHHAHNMFGGWGGVFLFFSVYPFFDQYMLFARGDSQLALVKGLLFLVSLFSMSYLVARLSRRTTDMPKDT